jgi:tetratricopeptide (TPR) repeat protein
VASLGTAIALSPRTAECYFNRALAFEALDRSEEAIRDYSRALELDSLFTDAALNLGIALFRAGRHAEALGALERAGATASSARVLGLVAYNRALIEIARNDLPAARASLQRAFELGDRDARELYDRLGPP